jgi:hypothetical protein
MIDNGAFQGLAVLSWDTTAKTANFTAVAGNGYFINTTSTAITMTLPASPSAGDQVGLKDYAGTFETNNCTIGRNGSNLDGNSADRALSTNNQSFTLVYVDATQGWIAVESGSGDIGVPPAFITATGGTITTTGNYKIHTFTSPGTFTVTSLGNPGGGPSTVDYLVAAGGGGGGGAANWANSGASGGGGGGYRESSGEDSGSYSRSPLGACVSALPVSITGYPITVGAGGAGGPGISSGSQGSNSIFSTITSTGGGYGASLAAAGSGGSGGGGSWCQSTTGGAGNTPPVSPPQGNPGGNGKDTGTPAVGGGGGATQAGGNPQPIGNLNGESGAGAESFITGSPLGRSGGGGGGQYNGGGPATDGSCGAGDGGCYQQPGGDGLANRAGGGGGGGNRGNAGGGDGGSGVVIIRYQFQ